MWSNNKSNNIACGIPYELRERYPLAFNHANYNCGSAREYDGGLQDMYMPGIVTPFNTSYEMYIYALVYPIAINNIPINVHINHGLRNYNDNWHGQYGIVYHEADRVYVEEQCNASYNLGLSTIVGAEICTSPNNNIIYIKDVNGANNNIHKVIACLYNLIDNKPECLSQLYTDLFNYSTSFITNYIKWMDTWYTQAADTYADRVYKKAISNITNRRVRLLQSEIDNKQSRIRSQEDALHTMYIELSQLQESYIGAKYNADKNGTEELKKAFKRCKNIKTIEGDSSGDGLIITFISPLFNYNLEVAERWCRQTGNLFANYNVQDLMYKLLVNGKYTLMFESRIHWYGDTSFERVRENNNYSYSMCPQPHIEYYNCFGDNKSQIREALASVDYALAIDCFNAAVSSLNIADAPVMNRLIEWLKENQDIKCVQNNETGELVSIKEVLEDDSINRPTT